MNGKFIVSEQPLTKKENSMVITFEYKNSRQFVLAQRQIAALNFSDSANIYHYRGDASGTQTWETLKTLRENLKIIDSGKHDNMLNKKFLKAYKETRSI